MNILERPSEEVAPPFYHKSKGYAYPSLNQFKILLTLGDCYTRYVKKQIKQLFFYKLYLHISNREVQVTCLNRD